MLLKFSDNCCSNVAHRSTALAFYLALLTMCFIVSSYVPSWCNNLQTVPSGNRVQILKHGRLYEKLHDKKNSMRTFTTDVIEELWDNVVGSKAFWVMFDRQAVFDFWWHHDYWSLISHEEPICVERDKKEGWWKDMVQQAEFSVAQSSLWYQCLADCCVQQWFAMPSDHHSNHYGTKLHNTQCVFWTGCARG